MNPYCTENVTGPTFATGVYIPERISDLFKNNTTLNDFCRHRSLYYRKMLI